MENKNKDTINIPKWKKKKEKEEKRETRRNNSLLRMLCDWVNFIRKL